MISIEKIIQNIEKYNKNMDKDKIIKAYLFSEKAHKGQKRKSGEPYIIHPLHVAYYLSEQKADEDSIIAALLHDVIEDTKVNVDEIKENFGETVTDIIEGLTKLKILKDEEYSRKDKLARNLRKMFKSMEKDLRIIIIKIFDRIHNMETLEHVSREKQLSKVQETIDVFIPITKILGLWKEKKQLEDLCFYYLENKKYIEIENFINSLRNQKQQYFEKIKDIVRNILKEESLEEGVFIDFKGVKEVEDYILKEDITIKEYKNPYILTIKIPNEISCYSILEKIHALWKPVHYNLKDYIASPKNSYYKGLHTSVIGPDSNFLTIRVLTENMHEIAEKGVLNNVFNKNSIVPTWLVEILDMMNNVYDSEHFLGELTENILGRRKLIMNSKGEIINLPFYASGIDYAFSQHKDVSKKWSLKINGKECSIICMLKDGDVVEIFYDEENGESLHTIWILYCQTYEARNGIMKYLADIPRNKAIEYGESVLRRELRIESRIPIVVMTDDMLIQLYTKNGCSTLKELFEKLGRGLLNSRDVYKTIFIPRYLEDRSSLIINLCATKDRSGFFQEILTVVKANKCNNLDARGIAPLEGNVEDVTCRVEFSFENPENVYTLCIRLEQLRHMGKIFFDLK